MGKVKILLGASVLIFSAVANASLISRDYLTHGDNLITFDTETNFEWLDLTVTQGLSVDEVESSRYLKKERFRYATIDDLSTLFNHAGISEFNRLPVLTREIDEVKLLINLVGVTSTSPEGYLRSHGLHSPYTTTGGALSGDWARWTTIQTWTDERYGISVVSGESVQQSSSYSNFGSHLVRVPAPPPLFLFLTGILFLGIARRRITR